LVPGFNVAFWGGVGAVSTTAGFGIANIESDLVPDCNPYADRQAALQKIPDDELEITITPYSHVYDIVSNPIKIKVKPSCMEYGLNCGDYNEYKEYRFTGAVHKGMSGAIIACDVCETGFIELNAHLEPSASMPEDLEFQAFNEEAVPTSLYWAAPGDENTCSGGDAPETEQYFLVKRSGTGYRKMWGGWAEKRTGYDYHYWYILPKDFNKKLADANKFTEFTNNACWWEDAEGNQSPTSIPICPCATYPDIWEDGKVELIGIFETWEEMDPYRCDTYQFDPGNIICTQWEMDSDPKYWNNINSICGY
jgi:hypothetical protein